MEKQGDLRSLLELMCTFTTHEAERDNESRMAVAKVNSSLKQISPRAMNSQGHSLTNPSSSGESLDFGLVDSLTLVDCKKLAFDTEEETCFGDVMDNNDLQLAPRTTLLQVRKRTGVRRGQEMTFTVRTKSC